MSDIQTVKHYLLNLQTQLCHTLETFERNREFISDSWHYQGGGGGESRVLENGDVIERAGVNFSHVNGHNLPPSASERRPHLANNPFQALGMSTVIHPKNPYVPTAHANFRCFQVESSEHGTVWWFGGGFDLTPYYGFEEDCVLWHEHARKACETLDSEVYERFKQWCDDYFYLRHRREQRGIGGLFFDDVNEWPFEQCFEFVQACGEHFIQAYRTIMERRKDYEYGERERQFQKYRRGRYVEFNLLFDRGTLFGIQSGGRTESILVSMPPEVSWRYNWQPEPNTPEAELYDKFLVPQDWLSVTTA